MLVPDEAVDQLASGPATAPAPERAATAPPAGPALAGDGVPAPGEPAAAPAEPAAAPAEPAAAAEAATNSAAQGEFLAGDGIRGVGMICIIVAHLAGGTLLIDHVYERGFRAGYGLLAGVLLSGLQLALPVFFVLSAYLISRPYVRAYVLGRRTPSLRRYLRHRVLRIVPVFWLLSAVMLAVYGVQGSGPTDVAALFGFVQIYAPSGAASFVGQAWTIDVEVAFYLIVPLSAFLVARATRVRAARRGGRELSRRGRVVLITGLLGLATVLSVWVRARTSGTVWMESPPATFYFFAPGVALAALELEFAGPLAAGRLPRLALAFGVAAAGLAAVLAVTTSTRSNALLQSGGMGTSLAVAVATGLAFAALLVRQRARGDSPRWVDNRATRWLGARSYPCYIIQSATVLEVVRIVGRVGGPWTELLALTALGLPLTLAAGAIVHAAVERPVLAWGRGRTFRAVVPRNG